jgi:mannosyltransferase OCH1-like enzyme
MIPKVIYMCHKQLDKIKIYSQNWKRLNPEYEIQCYDDAMCRNFLLKEYD